MSTILYLQKKFQQFCAFGAGLSMALMFGIVFVNSLRRYTTGKSLVFGEELPVYLAIYGFMFGLGFAYIQYRHITFNILTSVLHQGLQKILLIIVEFATIIIGATLAYSGWLTTLKRGNIEASSLIGSARDLANMLGIPALETLGHMSAWLFAVSFGGVILCVAAILKFLEQTMSLREGGE